MRRDAYHDFVSRRECVDLGWFATAELHNRAVANFCEQRRRDLLARSGAAAVSSGIVKWDYDARTDTQRMWITFDSSKWTGRRTLKPAIQRPNAIMKFLRRFGL